MSRGYPEGKSWQAKSGGFNSGLSKLRQAKSGQVKSKKVKLGRVQLEWVKCGQVTLGEISTDKARRGHQVGAGQSRAG